MELLSAAERAAFAEQGYVGPFDLISGEAAAALRDDVVANVLPQRSWTYDHTKGDYALLHHHRDRHLDSAAVFALCAQRGIVDRIRGLLGDDILLWRSDFFVQSKTDPNTKPHQDKKFSGMRAIPALENPDGTMPLNVTAWIALTEMTEDRGGLFLVPGSQKEGVIEEVPVADRAQSIFGKGTRLAKYDDGVGYYRPPMKAGQFILFDNLIVHGSSPTRSDETRVAISARYVAPTVRINPRGTELSGHGMDLSRFGSLVVAGSAAGSGNVLREPPR